MYLFASFLVACYATLHPALSFFFCFFSRSLFSLLLPKWSSDLKYSPCPPTCDWGSRVSGLVGLRKASILIISLIRIFFCHIHCTSICTWSALTMTTGKCAFQTIFAASTSCRSAICGAITSKDFKQFRRGRWKICQYRGVSWISELPTPWFFLQIAMRIFPLTNL